MKLPDRESALRVQPKEYLVGSSPSRDVSEHGGSTLFVRSVCFGQGVCMLRDAHGTEKCLVREVVRVGPLAADGQRQVNARLRNHHVCGSFFVQMGKMGSMDFGLQRNLWLVSGPKALGCFSGYST